MRATSSKTRPEKPRLGSKIPQVAMNCCDDDRSLSDGRRYALHRARPHITASENPSHRSLERTGILGCGRSPDESFRVHLHAAGQPLCTRVGADHDEQVVGCEAVIVRGIEGAPSNMAQMSVPLQGYYLRTRMKGDRLGCMNPLYQVVRHGAGKEWSPDQHMHMAGMRGEIHGRLAGGVPPPTITTG